MVQKKNYNKSFSSLNAYLLRAKLIGLINKDGKKFLATKIVDRVLSQSAFRFKVTPARILAGLLRVLDINIEVKKVKIRKAVSIVPFAVNRSRKIFLLVKNILTCINLDSRQISFERKLYEEIVKILTSQPCNSLKILRENLLLAKQHRSNAHFRW